MWTSCLYIFALGALVVVASVGASPCTDRCAARARKYRGRVIHDACLADGREGRIREGTDVPRGWSRLCTAIAQRAVTHGCRAGCKAGGVDCGAAHDPKYGVKCKTTFVRYRSNALNQRCGEMYLAVAHEECLLSAAGAAEVSSPEAFAEAAAATTAAVEAAAAQAEDAAFAEEQADEEAMKAQKRPEVCDWGDSVDTKETGVLTDTCENHHATVPIPASPAGVATLAVAQWRPPTSQRYKRLPTLGVDTFLAFRRNLEHASYDWHSGLNRARNQGRLETDQPRLGDWLSWKYPVKAASDDSVERGNHFPGVSLTRQTDTAPNSFHTQRCVEEEEGWLKARLYVTNGAHWTPWATRYPNPPNTGGASSTLHKKCHNLRCACGRSCGFGIFDDVFTPEQLFDIMGVVQSPASFDDDGQMLSRQKSILYAKLTPPVAARMVAHFDIRNPTHLERDNARFDRDIRHESKCEMHGDFMSVGSYVYTAIVYLSDWNTTFSGGETVFAHHVDGAPPFNPYAWHGGAQQEEEKSQASPLQWPRVTDDTGQRLAPIVLGEIVQPKVGRVVLFSGGPENLHCKMPSLATGRNATLGGRRTVVQLWFRCRAVQP